jgi:Ca2+-binding EF-hand superfamily protein
MKRFTLGLIATAILAVAGQDSQPGQDNQQAGERHKRRDPAKMFSRADQNSDGKISLDEFLALRGRRPDNAEAQTDHTERRTAMFKRLDANSDGFVTTEEFQAFAGKHGRKHQKSANQQ